MARDRASEGTTDVQGAGAGGAIDAGQLDTLAADPSAPAPAAIRSTDGERRRGDTLGRYVILEQLGAGGMGVVYAAYDPQLDRKVAVKLLHRRGRAGGTARLLREAQAMAKLSHPNVVAVLDVGQRDEHVFVAMEYVAGTTLTAWLVAPRTWREVLDVFVAAGRGLAAAHVAGLLHRDVKPDNVLVGDDGRVRVADFGLARAAGESLTSSVSTVPDEPLLVSASESLGERTEPDGIDARSNVLGAHLTRTGSMLGTPAYMAPEQYRGESAAAADQFSFCVALYEGLYGARPFAGATVDELQDAIVAGRVREPPPGTQVPPWLRRVVVRGLAADPAARFASMDELLAALARDPTRRRARIVAASAAVVVLGGGAAVALALRGGHESACPRAADPAEAVWGASRKAAVQSAFERTQVPYAPIAWRSVDGTFDAYARRWGVLRVAACRAGEGGDPAAAPRAACLDRRLAELDEQVRLFAAADGPMVARAVVAAQRLPTLDSCDDPHVLASAGLDDAPTRAAAAPLWALLDQAIPRVGAGKPAEARPLAERAVAEAKRLKLPRVEGEAEAVLGKALDSLGDQPGAEQAYFAAARAGIAGGDDLRTLDAWSELAFIVGYEEQHHAEGRRWAELAAATVERLGGDERMRADLASLLGTLAWADGDNATARREHTAALDTRLRLLGPQDLDTATSLVNLALVEKADGHYDQAAAYTKRAIDAFVAQLGPDHPRLAGVYSNLGNVYEAKGDEPSALEWHQRAVAVAEKTLPPDAPDLAFYLTNMGASLANLGRDDDALPVYRRALAIQEHAEGDHPDIALTLSNIALIDLAHHRTADAQAGFARALAIDEHALGADHPTVAGDLDNLGEAEHALGRDADALARHQRSVAIREKALGADNPQLAESLVGEGESLIALGRAAEAIAPLERAVALREHAGADPVEIADARFALARALDAAGRDRVRAVSLASRALDAFVAAGAGAASRRRDAEAWLAAHGAGPR